MRRRLLTILIASVALCCLVPSVALAKSVTKLSIGVSSSYEHYDRKPTISGRLTTASGKPVAKATVKLYCGSVYMGSKRSDSQGKVRFIAELPEPRLSGTWKLKYAGSSARQAAASGSKATRIHVHFNGPASRRGEGADPDDDGSEEVYPDEWVTLSESSGMAASTEPGLDPSLDTGAEPGLDPSLDNVLDSPVDDGTDDPTGEEEAFVSGSLFGIVLDLDGGRTYGLKLSEPAWCRVDDSEGLSMFMSDECADTYDFSPDSGDQFSLLFDTGFSYDDLGELDVLVW